MSRKPASTTCALLTKANDYGIVQLYLDGQKAGGPIDLYCRDLVVTDPPAPLGVHELAAGQHKLTVEIIGSNKKAKNRTLFGLIRLVLEPASSSLVWPPAACRHRP